MKGQILISNSNRSFVADAISIFFYAFIFYSMLWSSAAALQMNEQLNNNLDISFSVLCRAANAFWNM